MRLWPVAMFALCTVAAAQVPVAPPPPPPLPSQGPVRDPGRRPPPEPVGTGIIRGRVVAADSGNPVRRANVTLMPSPPPSPPAGSGTTATTTTSMVITQNGVPVQVNGNLTGMRPRNVTTDSQGNFEFTALPAGAYRVQAIPGQYTAAYLGLAFGAKKPNGPGNFDPGTPIQLGDGQTFDKVVIGLPRGAVITGRVTDENGEPLARVQVFTLLYPSASARGQRTGPGAQTDDLGQFRLFGLAPGEFAVAAQASMNTFVPPNAPPETDDDKTGFMTTYFPGTPDEAAAQRVRTRAGGETPGVEIHMVTGRLFHVTGTVMDSQGRPLNRGNGSIVKRSIGGMSSDYGFSIDEAGRFQMRNIPPGNYRLNVRQQVQRIVNGQVEGNPNAAAEFASVPLSVAGDVDGLTVVTGPGTTITGQIVFQDGPPQLPPNAQGLQMRVNATPGDPENMVGVPTPPGVQVGPDLTFTMKGMMGEYVLRTGMGNQYLKSVTLGSDDITDTPREFKNGDRVTITLTSRASTLEGNVTDDKGQPITDASVILFSEDKASWRSNSFRTRRSGPDPNGHYRIQGLMAGRYFIAALPRDRFVGISVDAALFEQLSKDATSLVIGEDDQRQVDLKVLAGPGGL